MGNLYKIFLILLLSFYYINMDAQTGILDINISQNGMDDEHVTVQVFQGDSLVSEHKAFFYDFDEFYDTLNVGFYDVKLYVNFDKDITETIKSVEIRSSERNRLYFTLPDTFSYHYDNKYNRNDTSIISKPVNLWHFSLGNHFINNNDVFTSYCEFGIKSGQEVALYKHFSLGVQGGSSMNWTNFDKNHSISPQFKHQEERYYYWNFNMLLFGRLTSYNNKTWGNDGLNLDAGISYNFPLIYRYVLIQNSTKTIKSHIHKYNDFSTIIRLGYSSVYFTFEYRLTNFLKEAYPEQPKYKLGIAISFVTD